MTCLLCEAGNGIVYAGGLPYHGYSAPDWKLKPENICKEELSEIRADRFAGLDLDEFQY